MNEYSLAKDQSLIIKITMKRKDYRKPTMQIVMLRSAQPLLTGSGEKPDYIPEEW